MTKPILSPKARSDEAMDGDPMTRGLDVQFDGNPIRLLEQINAFDGLAQTNEHTQEWKNGSPQQRDTIEAFDGNAMTNKDNDHFRSGRSFDYNRTLDRLDGKAETNLENERRHDGRSHDQDAAYAARDGQRHDHAPAEDQKVEAVKPKKLPTPFDRFKPSPYDR